MPDQSAVWDWLGDALSTELFTVNDTPITAVSLALFAMMATAALLIARRIARISASRLAKRFDVDRGTEFTVRRLLQYALTAAGVIVAFQFIGVDFSTLAVFFGFLSVGIGFGLQNVTSNFVAGLILLFERPIKIGDRVTIGDLEGDVTQINMRSTTVRSVRNISVIVPNADFISDKVVNWSHGEPTVALWIDVGVAYDSDLDGVIRALTEVAEEHDATLQYPAPEVRLLSFGDSAWDMRLIAWVDDPQANRSISSELNMAIVRKFNEAEIEIPFPQRDLHFRNRLSWSTPDEDGGDDSASVHRRAAG